MATAELVMDPHTAELPPNHSFIATLDHTGDSRFMWDRTKSVEVEGAKAHFKKLKDEGYTIYKAVGEKGEKGEVLNSFDPAAERVIAIPRMVGG